MKKRVFIKHSISLLLFIFSLLSFAFCEQPEIIIEDHLSKDARPAFNKFTSLVKRGNISDSFLFFTDPHLLGASNKFSEDERCQLLGAFDLAKELYDTLKLGFCLCGGDWLNYGDTQEMAKEKLLFADRQMKLFFPAYFKMMGNHDTNYQGIVSEEDKTRGDLSRSFADKEYFFETGSAYYSFCGNKTRFFILDSGLDWSVSMDDYRWEQMHWLADQLQNNHYEHIAIGIHMFYTDSGKLTSMSELLISICDAYNSNQILTIQNTIYDYSLTKGKIYFILAGHNHSDGLTYVGKESNLPIIRTVNFNKEGSWSFDICAINYQNKKLDLIRVGLGEDRRIEL